MKVKVKVKRLFDLERTLKAHGHIKYGKVMWMLARNATIIKPFIDNVRELTQPTPEMRKLEPERIKLGREHSEKDAKGKPMQRVNPETGRPQFVIMDMGAYEEELERLIGEKFPQAKLDQEELSERGEELLEEEVEVEFYKLPLYKVPGFRNDEDDDNGIIMAKDMPIFIELGIIVEEERPCLEAAVEGNTSEKPADEAKLKSV